MGVGLNQHLALPERGLRGGKRAKTALQPAWRARFPSSTDHKVLKTGTVSDPVQIPSPPPHSFLQDQ